MIPYWRRVLSFGGIGLMAFVAACSPAPTQSTATPEGLLYQVGLLDQLAAGAFSGFATIEQTLDNGDFGLGTLDGLDGELIVLAGEAFHVGTDGVASVVPGSDLTPFATVTQFKSSWDDETLGDGKSCAQIEKLLDSKLAPESTAFAIQIAGQFKSIRTRSVPKQAEPYPTLEQVVAADQVEFDLKDVTGTMVGFRLPKAMDGANAAGYHFHFLTEDRKTGGHVLECKTADTQASAEPMETWLVDLDPS